MVRLDPGTGESSRVERYLVANDIGRAINPMLVEGQIVGGFAQGLGGALFEEFRYDESRASLCRPPSPTTSSPPSPKCPKVDVLIAEDAPSPLNPLGVKGAGEGGTNGVGAAIASAVDDALRQPGAITTPADPATPPFTPPAAGGRAMKPPVFDYHAPTTHRRSRQLCWARWTMPACSPAASR